MTIPVAERSESFESGSIGSVVAQLLHWASNTSSGMALVSYQSFFAAQTAMRRLQAELSTSRVLTLDPAVSEDGTALQSIMRAIVDATADEVLSIHLAPQSERFFGDLNLFREKVRACPAKIIWWAGPDAYARLLHGASDFVSWIQPRLILTEVPVDVPPFHLRFLPVSDPLAVQERTDPLGAREHAHHASERIRNARAARIAEEEIWRDLLDPAMLQLAAAGLVTEAVEMFVGLRETVRRDVHLLVLQSDRLIKLGASRLAERILIDEALPQCPIPGRELDRVEVLERIAQILELRGETEQALRILQEEVLPIVESNGTAGLRATVLGKIADVLAGKGEIGKACKIWREQVPVFAAAGDVRAQAAGLGRIADFYLTRGQLDEALRISELEQMPLVLKTGDQLEIAAALYGIAELHHARGEFEVALDLLRKEVIPRLQANGRVADLALAHGRVARVLTSQGRVDEALTIYREKALPILDATGHAGNRAVCLVRIGDILFQKGALDDALATWQIAIGDFERIGDGPSLMAAKASVAKALAAKGHYGKALRMLRDAMEFFRSHDLERELLVTKADFAQILATRTMNSPLAPGNGFDEPIRILEMEVIPGFRALGFAHDAEEAAVRLESIKASSAEIC